MSESLWAEVDEYFTERQIPGDPVLDAALADARAAGLPEISVSPMQGKLLWLMTRSHGAHTVLEFGTLAGYSTIWLARALPEDGSLISLEYDPKHAEVARANIARAGLADRVDVRVGAALDTLPKLLAEGQGPFDVVFIDANKDDYPEYLEWSLRLTRPGSLIIADNVVRQGGVVDASSTSPLIQGVRRFTDLIAGEPRLAATTIQTVGVKGYDGLTFALVVGE